MVLRRTLPSRVMVDGATPLAENKASAPHSSGSEGIAQQAAGAAQAAARAAQDAAEAASRAAALAADLDDLPSASQPQQLEDSFAAAPMATQSAAQPAPFTTPVVEPTAPVAQPAAPEASVASGIDYFRKAELADATTGPKVASFTAGADPFSPAPAAAKAEAGLEQQALEHFRQNKSDVENTFTVKSADVTGMADPFAPASATNTRAEPRPVAEPAKAPETIAPVAEPVATPVAANEPQEPIAPPQAPVAPQPAAAPQPQAAAADATPSRPSNNSMKRRVREKTPRNFAFTPSAIPAAAAPDVLPPAPASASFEASADETNDTLNSPVPTAPGNPEVTSFLPSFTEPAAVPEAPAMAESSVPELPQPQSFGVSETPSWQPAELPDGGIDDAPVSFQPAPLPQPPLPPAPGSLSNTAPLASTYASESDQLAPASDLPWVAGGQSGSDNAPGSSAEGAGWHVETPGAPSDASPFSAPAAPLDIYGNMNGSMATAATPGVPAYLANNGNGNAPELPKAGAKTRTGNAGGGNTMQWAIGAIVVAVVGFAAFQLVKNDESQERVARLTGVLTETTEKLPPELGGVQNTGADVLEPEQVIAMGDMNQTGILPPPPATGAENSTFQPLIPATTSSSGALIDFADVPASEASQKIVGDNSQAMPEDIGLIAKFQQAVADEKARQSGTPAPAPVAAGTTAPAADPSIQSPGLTPAQKEAQNLQLQAKLEAELAAYRETLASSETPAAAPKPSDFFKNPESFVNGTATLPKGAATTTLQPPVATSAEQSAMLAPNPNNLPILAEPTAAAEPQIRQLGDFNVDAFEPQEDRVRIPKGIRPRFASTEFPEMEVLSFVPGRGVIAFNRGREGVLLIGESLEGWELMSVSVDKAEFRNGRSVQYVSAE